MWRARESACSAFANPTKPRADTIDRQLRSRRAYALEHYPDLYPEILAQVLRIERGLILSDADIIAIQMARDKRVRRSARAAAPPQAGRASSGFLRLLLNRLGLS